MSIRKSILHSLDHLLDPLIVKQFHCPKKKGASKMNRLLPYTEAKRKIAFEVKHFIMPDDKMIQMQNHMRTQYKELPTFDSNVPIIYSYLSENSDMIMSRGIMRRYRNSSITIKNYKKLSFAKTNFYKDWNMEHYHPSYNLFKKYAEIRD